MCARRAEPPYTVAMSASKESRSGILMLCLGNICRSPAAEAVMNGVLQRRTLSDSFFVDSCGTGGGSPGWYLPGGHSHHRGDPPDPRMRAAAEARGLTLVSQSRPLEPADFDKFDIIVAMDETNIEAIEDARACWQLPADKAEVVLMSQFSPDKSFRGRAVPDPYWSGPKGFEHALDLIEGACEGLADELIKRKQESQ